MPNRKVDSGWFRLPKSGALYYGPVPEDANRLTDEEVSELAAAAGADQPVDEPATPKKKQTSGAPAADKGGATEGATG